MSDPFSNQRYMQPPPLPPSGRSAGTPSRSDPGSAGPFRQVSVPGQSGPSSGSRVPRSAIAGSPLNQRPGPTRGTVRGPRTPRPGEQSTTSVRYSGMSSTRTPPQSQASSRSYHPYPPRPAYRGDVLPPSRTADRLPVHVQAGFDPRVDWQGASVLASAIASARPPPQSLPQLTVQDAGEPTKRLAWVRSIRPMLIRVAPEATGEMVFTLGLDSFLQNEVLDHLQAAPQFASVPAGSLPLWFTFDDLLDVLTLLRQRDDEPVSTVEAFLSLVLQPADTPGMTNGPARGVLSRASHMFLAAQSEVSRLDKPFETICQVLFALCMSRTNNAAVPVLAKMRNDVPKYYKTSAREMSFAFSHVLAQSRPDPLRSGSETSRGTRRTANMLECAGCAGCSGDAGGASNNAMLTQPFPPPPLSDVPPEVSSLPGLCPASTAMFIAEVPSGPPQHASLFSDASKPTCARWVMVTGPAAGPPSDRCWWCSGVGHRMAECAVLKEYVKGGGKYCFRCMREGRAFKGHSLSDCKHAASRPGGRIAPRPATQS